MEKKRVLIMGATSSVAQSIAYKYAEKGHGLYLSARKIERLTPLKKDIVLRHNVQVDCIELDANKMNHFKKILTPIITNIDTVICLWGCMYPQDETEKNEDLFIETMTINYTAPAFALNIIATEFAQRKNGSIIGFSSVAGLRGRQSNYSYGSAKAGFTTFLNGLRNKLYQSQVHVMTVLPGFMDTKMIADMDTPKILTISPDKVAKLLYKNHKKRKDIIYLYPIWRYIMLIIRNIPEFIFKRLNI